MKGGRGTGGMSIGGRGVMRAKGRRGRFSRGKGRESDRIANTMS